jgi:hypothetical protein
MYHLYNTDSSMCREEGQRESCVCVALLWMIITRKIEREDSIEMRCNLYISLMEMMKSDPISRGSRQNHLPFIISIVCR